MLAVGRCREGQWVWDPADWIIDPEAVSPLNPKGLVHCTIYLWQQDNTGQWFKVKGEADWDEFAPIAEEWAEGEDGRRRPTGKKVLDTSGNWAKMPKVMLEKCAEAQALRVSSSTPQAHCGGTSLSLVCPMDPGRLL